MEIAHLASLEQGEGSHFLIGVVTKITSHTKTCRQRGAQAGHSTMADGTKQSRCGSIDSNIGRPAGQLGKSNARPPRATRSAKPSVEQRSSAEGLLATIFYDMRR